MCVCVCVGIPDCVVGSVLFGLEMAPRGSYPSAHWVPFFPCLGKQIDRYLTCSDSGTGIGSGFLYKGNGGFILVIVQAADGWEGYDWVIRKRATDVYIRCKCKCAVM